MCYTNRRCLIWGVAAATSTGHLSSCLWCLYLIRWQAIFLDVCNDWVSRIIQLTPPVFLSAMTILIANPLTYDFHVEMPSWKLSCLSLRTQGKSSCLIWANHKSVQHTGSTLEAHSLLPASCVSHHFMLDTAKCPFNLPICPTLIFLHHIFRYL